MLENIEVLGHSSIRINKENKIIYIDPFKIKKDYLDADMIFITHSHYDHFSIDDIKKLVKQETIIITVEETKDALMRNGVKEENIIIVKPYEEHVVNGIKVKTVPAYNELKDYHIRENDWVGYVIELEGNKYYILGDTDDVPEIRNIECDVAFIPVGGEYTMDVDEAANYAMKLNPKIAVPVHYGMIVGNKNLGKEFKSLLEDIVKVEILIK